MSLRYMKKYKWCKTSFEGIYIHVRFNIDKVTEIDQDLIKSMAEKIRTTLGLKDHAIILGSPRTQEYVG